MNRLDPLRKYLRFARCEARPLGFGINFTFLSSFGQTFLLSLFVPHFIEVFDLTKASFGTLYSALTLTSALAIPLLGGWIDRAPLRLYSFLVMAGIVAGALGGTLRRVRAGTRPLAVLLADGLRHVPQSHAYGLAPRRRRELPDNSRLGTPDDRRLDRGGVRRYFREVNHGKTVN